jgi:sterol desaturase/sphingolipid hydroxylase (fatty acid hydroxylase superfamily)
LYCANITLSLNNQLHQSLAALGGISIGVFAETMERVGYSLTNKIQVPFSTNLLQFGIYFVSFDLYYYLLHRFVLHGKYGWWFHKEHHSSFICNPTTGFSFHAIEAIITGGFNPFLGWLLQFHPTTIILVQLYGLTSTVIVHSGYEYYPIEWNKKCYTKWYLSAQFHDVHHTNVSCNYGAFTTIYDRIFSTVHHDFDTKVDGVINNYRAVLAGKNEQRKLL